MVILGIDLVIKILVYKLVDTSNEILSNSQSKRTTPTLISFKGKYFSGENVNNLLISNYMYSFIILKMIDLFVNNNETLNMNTIKRENNTILLK